MSVSCLASLRAQVAPQEIQVEVFLVDDASTDGTATAVQTAWPGIHLLSGNGSLYWNGGMRVAWEAAAHGDPDYYLLLNDDTRMAPEALAALLNLSPDPSLAVIAVGAIADPANSRQVYGGWRKRGRAMVLADGVAHECATFNANCALVPRAVYQRIGIFYPGYTHAMGDFDYGFAARRAGCSIVQTPATIGSCSPNLEAGTWRDRRLPRSVRWSKIMSPKGLPLAEWCRYTWRNEGFLWALRFISPYLKVLLGR